MKRIQISLTAILFVVNFGVIAAQTWNNNSKVDYQTAILEDSTLTISGTGPLSNSFWDSAIESQVKQVIIEDELTSIGIAVFDNYTNLTEITIPEGVTSIGNAAFLNCTSLAKITLPQSVKTIGISAFESCTALTGIAIPENVTSIENFVFLYCSNLTSVIIPKSVTSIGSSAFEECINLRSITLPESVASINDYAFLGCISLTEITIPENVKTIEEGVFYNCTGLTKIVLPDSVTTIKSNAFSRCSGITEINIPNGVTSLKDAGQPFYFWSDLTSLTTFIVKEDHEFFSVEDGMLYSKNKDTLLICPRGKTGTCVIPESVAAIDLYAFFCMSEGDPIKIDTLKVFWEKPIEVCFNVSPSCVLSIPAGTKREYQVFRDFFAEIVGGENNDASLGGIHVSFFEEGYQMKNFTITAMDTTINVVNDTKNFTINYSPVDWKATVNPMSIWPADLAVGKNTFEIIVTAEDGVTTKTYTITIIRAANNDATLKNLTVSAGILNYDLKSVDVPVNVANKIESITFLDIIPNDSNATVANDALGEKKLAVGENIFNIVVTAADSVTTKTYTLVFIRAASDDASFQSLSITPSDFEYDASSHIHTVEVDYLVDEITIEAISNHPNAIIEGDLGVNSLAFGENMFWIIVTAEDGKTSITDTVIVIRKNLPVIIIPAEDAAEVVVQYVKNAGGYILNIYGDEECTDLICTMEFDESGNLIYISILKSGNEGQIATSSFSYTVENLENNTTYYYVLKAFNANNDELTSETGFFRTTGEGGTVDVVEALHETSLPEIIGYSTISGVKLPESPEKGVYIILYEDGSSKKTVKLK